MVSSLPVRPLDPQRPAPHSAPLAVDLLSNPPDANLIHELGPRRCVRDTLVPVKRLGGATLVATPDPDAAHMRRIPFPPGFGSPVFVRANRSDIETAVTSGCGASLIAQAEVDVTEYESCRFWYQGFPRKVLFTLLLALASALLLAPHPTIFVLFSWAIFTLLALTALKASALVPNRETDSPPVCPDRLPRISVLVPLYKEVDILDRLIARLSRVDYPTDRLEVCLVTEGDDIATRRILARATLPSWMRVICVPASQIRTKPRALNYALDFCNGEIIGIWDAEDAPDPDQLKKVAAYFADSPGDVACLQGTLDYYNERQNWLTRCFTVEYGAWWRVILKGVERLGLVLPLGGTTLFFRRDILEELGRWDAHNVTEDADLGIRLARHGYRTRLIPTTTKEEATARPWPWVRQRSRWIKGFMMTWATHMRFPRLLYRQLGLRRFLGIQLLFLAGLSQVILAPVLWSMWLIPLGLDHPLEATLSPSWMASCAVLFLCCELVTIATGVLGACRTGKKGLWLWAPTLHFYYPMACLAAYKALFEMLVSPFFWDKTAHGHAPAEAQTSEP